MRFLVCPVVLCCCLAVVSSEIFAQPPKESYPVHPDSKVKPGVPQGKVTGPFSWKSKIFPGTVRDYWVYVPSQYDSTKEACVMIVQDGLGKAKGWKVPTILDNLIHEGAVPVQIGIFISPGVVPAPNADAQPRFNRSFEYDGVGDRYARFLIDEILPAVKKDYNLSDNPNDYLLAGSSSGAIAAFNAAWERPDHFRRVFSSVGTFVGLRGGNEFPILVRKHETKPIRVFLQDGSNDLDIYGGSWWHSNLQMLSALKYSGYGVNHVWGEGGHNGKHSTAILPDALRWLWHDYPKPITAGTPPNRRTQLLIPGEDWELVSEGHKFTEGPAVNEEGEVFFTDIPNSTIHKVANDGTVSVFKEKSPGVNGLMFGADGKLYACQNGRQRIVRYDADGNEEIVVEGVSSNDILVLPEFGYFTDPKNQKVWMFTFDGEKREVDSGIEFPNGVIASPDQSLLTVSDTRGRFTFSYQIQPDGTLKHKQVYGHLHLPEETGQSGADGMAVDTEGRTYVTTRVGLQVLDQLGRVHVIIRKPQDAWLSNVVFAGNIRDILYVTCGGKVYRRKVNATGVTPWKAAIKPPKPQL
ncbi:MAG: SMP-30/gluconolactonase/LRE family protein [Planctomycetaceae bacterium]|nr:SMP-30/gluconolactonase/LRE family protein [Planctomycetaceae bacterium]